MADIADLYSFKHLSATAKATAISLHEEENKEEGTEIPFNPASNALYYADGVAYNMDAK